MCLPKPRSPAGPLDDVSMSTFTESPWPRSERASRPVECNATRYDCFYCTPANATAIACLREGANQFQGDFVVSGDVSALPRPVKSRFMAPSGAANAFGSALRVHLGHGWRSYTGNLLVLFLLENRYLPKCHPHCLQNCSNSQPLPKNFSSMPCARKACQIVATLMGIIGFLS